MSQQMPDDDRELARDGNRSDVVAATAGDALVERSQGSGTTHRLPRGLDQHAARMRAALFGNPSVSWATLARLVHARVQPEIGDQLVGRGEAVDRADRGQYAEGDHHVDSGDR